MPDGRPGSVDQLLLICSSTVLLGLLIALPGGALAAPDEAPIPRSIDPLFVSGIDARGGYQFDADTTGGDFSAWRAYAGETLVFPMLADVDVVLLGSYNGDFYDFSGFANDPWDSIHALRLTPLLDVGIGERWSAFGGPVLDFAFERGADFGDAFRPGLLAGGAFQPSDTLRIALGIIAVSDLEDGWYVQPMFDLKWLVAESLLVEAEAWSTRGGSAALRYRALDCLELGFGAAYQRERFRLNKRTILIPPSTVIPQPTSEGIGEDSSYDVSGWISFLPDIEPFPNMRVDLLVGVALGGSLELESSNGTMLSQSDYDPAPFVGLRIVVPLPDSIFGFEHDDEAEPPLVPF